MTRRDDADTPAGAPRGRVEPLAPTHPRLQAALLMIGIVVFLVAVSVASVL